MVKLKPSNQSLAARGLPTNPAPAKKRVVKKKKPLPKKDDSENSDKRHACMKGLNRCSSLLNAMLEQPSGPTPKPIKKKAIQKRSSTPVDPVGCNRFSKLPTAVSQITDSQVSDTNTIDELIEEKELLQKYLNKIVHRSSEIEKQVEAASNGVLLDIDQNSDVIRDGTKTANKNTANIVLNGSDCSKLYSSTNKENTNPTNDPNDRTLTNDNCNNASSVKGSIKIPERNESNKSELFELLESITSKLKVGDNDISANTENMLIQKETLFVNSQHVPDTKSTPQVKQPKSNARSGDKREEHNAQKAKTDILGTEEENKTKWVENYIQNISVGQNCIEDRRDMIFNEYRDNLPSFLQVSLGKTIDNSQISTDHSQYGSTLLHDTQSDIQSVKSKGPTPQNISNPRVMSNPKIVSNPTLVSKVPVASKPHVVTIPPIIIPQQTTLPPVDVSAYAESNSTILTNDVTQQPPDQTNVQLSTLDYLLKELRSKTSKEWNIEIDQLFNDIDHVIGSLSFLMHDGRTEINKFLHPLQVENTHLKKSEIMNDKVEDLNETINQLKENARSGDVSVDMIIKTVQNKLGLEQRLKVELNQELGELRQKNEELRKENGELVLAITEKEMKVLEQREFHIKEKSSKSQEIALLNARIEDFRVQRHGDEKERNIMGLTLRQKDYEIERLSKLNSDLQDSVSKLLTDISDVKRKQPHQPTFMTPVKQTTPGVENNHASPPKKYTPQPQFCEYLTHEINIPTNETTANDQTLTNLTPMSDPRKMMASFRSCANDNESYNDQLSTAVNNQSEGDSAAALSMRSKMSTLSETDFSLWSLATYDGAEFQRNIEHLDSEIKRIQSSMKRSNKK